MESDRDLGESGGVNTAPLALWRSTAPERSRMSQFKDMISKKYSVNLACYDDLYQWSIDHLASFWEEVWHFTGIRASQPFSKVAVNFCKIRLEACI